MHVQAFPIISRITLTQSPFHLTQFHAGRRNSQWILAKCSSLHQWMDANKRIQSFKKLGAGQCTFYQLSPSMASLVAWTVKCLPTMRETWVRYLGREDPLEKEMATHSSIHTWKIPWTEEPGGLQSMGLQRVGHDWATSLLLLLL